MYYLQSRYYDAKICRFINADAYVSTGQGFFSNNMFAYCENNPVMRIDPTGEFWFFDDIDYDEVSLEGAGAGSGGGYYYYYYGYDTSYYNSKVYYRTSLYNSYYGGYYHGGGGSRGGYTASFAIGNVSVTDSMAVGSSGTTIIYRSVSSAEALDIKNTGQFNISPNGMDCKQFGFDYGETAQFGQKVGQNIIVSARIPTSSLGRFYTQGVDTSIFRHGTLTVYGDDIGYFNQLIAGTIVFYR